MKIDQMREMANDPGHQIIRVHLRGSAILFSVKEKTDVS